MKKYVVKINGDFSKTFVSTSRNAKKHLRENGGDTCIVEDMHENPISGAKYSSELGYYNIVVA